MTLDLRTIVADALAASPHVDPLDVWPEIVEALPARQLREALLQAGRAYCTNVANDHRRAPARAAAAGSPRWDAVRDHFAELVARREYVAGTWKRLGDCCRDDLLWCAENRTLRATELTDAAARYKTAAAALDEHGAATVSDLPPSVALELELT